MILDHLLLRLLCAVQFAHVIEVAVGQSHCSIADQCVHRSQFSLYTDGLLISHGTGLCTEVRKFYCHLSTRSKSVVWPKGKVIRMLQSAASSSLASLQVCSSSILANRSTDWQVGGWPIRGWQCRLVIHLSGNQTLHYEPAMPVLHWTPDGVQGMWMLAPSIELHCLAWLISTQYAALPLCSTR